MNDRVGARTQDRLIKSQVLYQLSYATAKRHILTHLTPPEVILVKRKALLSGVIFEKKLNQSALSYYP